MLADSGFEASHETSSPTDIVVVNTCGFIGDAKEESVNTILEQVEAKNLGHIKELYVMGCLSERYRQDLQKELPEVDRFYGKFDWTSLVTDLTRRHPGAISYDRVITTPSHHAYLKIAEGCNRFCAFCAIPLITGRYKSRPIEEIEEEVRTLVARGVKEFNVIAQDLSYYGKDLYGRMAIAELVDAVANIDGVEWIRLHYAYPTDFPYDLLPVMARHANVCKYLDIALQHSSDNMLERMRRRITGAETRALLSRIRQEVPGIHIRTTLMVGFPGETDEDFENLLDFVREQRFERMGAFAYCEEEDTYAAEHFNDDVPDSAKHLRLDRLMALQEEIALEHNRSKIGTVVRVLIESENGGFYTGKSQYDSPEVDPEVLIDKSTCGVELNFGEMYDVEITDAMPYELFGRVV